ncbi:hypothetical protein [Allostreptomyces psammosilenae]|uniref:Nudix hydrolase domain-containing protein n=1 Tax=Allostreptomyces psammosilenae TaxID=1892865 RepID=A0A853A9U2_9ACTN|nr:hypothetical protein [Allostreptomyces psammosilenae]NYI07278.1 hypothetical protein [Allostreptomyces psammosilenae]
MTPHPSPRPALYLSLLATDHRGSVLAVQPYDSHRFRLPGGPVLTPGPLWNLASQLLHTETGLDFTASRPLVYDTHAANPVRNLPPTDVVLVDAGEWHPSTPLHLPPYLVTSMWVAAEYVCDVLSMEEARRVRAAEGIRHMPAHIALLYDGGPHPLVTRDAPPPEHAP